MPPKLLVARSDDARSLAPFSQVTCKILIEYISPVEQTAS